MFDIDPQKERNTHLADHTSLSTQLVVSLPYAPDKGAGRSRSPRQRMQRPRSASARVSSAHSSAAAGSGDLKAVVYIYEANDYIITPSYHVDDPPTSAWSTTHMSESAGTFFKNGGAGNTWDAYAVSKSPFSSLTIAQRSGTPLSSLRLCKTSAISDEHDCANGLRLEWSNTNAKVRHECQGGGALEDTTTAGAVVYCAWTQDSGGTLMLSHNRIFSDSRLSTDADATIHPLHAETPAIPRPRHCRGIAPSAVSDDALESSWYHVCGTQP